MKKTAFVLATLLVLLGCKKDENAIPSGPIIEDPNDDPPVIETDYIVLDGYIGRWQCSTILASDGNVIVAGYERIGANLQMIVTKTDTAGEVIFSTIFHQQNSAVMGVYEDSQKNIYVAGFSYDDNGDEGRDLAVGKLDENGNVIWEHTYPREESISGLSISAFNDNEIVVCGSKAEDHDLAFLMIDSLGQEKAFKLIETPNRFKYPTSMLILQDGNILVTDYEENNFNLTWYDQDFNLLWEKTYGDGHRVCRSAIQLEDGSIVTVGRHSHVKEGSNAIDSSKVLILKTDSEGEIIWEKEAGDSKYINDGQSIAVGEDGSFVITGYVLSDLPHQTDHMIVYVDAEGNEISAKYFTDELTSRGTNIIKVGNGKNIMTGGCQGGTFFLKVDNYGN